VAAERRTLLLGAVLIVALVVFLIVRSTSGTPSAAASRPGQPARPVANTNTPPASLDAAKVNLTELEKKRTGPADSGRNPFRFEPKAPPPPPPSEAASAAVATQMPMVPTGPPPPPPIPLKFIGLVEKIDGTKIAVLSDGRRPHSGVEGQEIDGRYRILKIGTESIEMAYLDGRGRQTIRLTGQ
jgi:hypothetical protein